MWLVDGWQSGGKATARHLQGEQGLAAARLSLAKAHPAASATQRLAAICNRWRGWLSIWIAPARSGPLTVSSSVLRPPITQAPTLPAGRLLMAPDGQK